MPQLAHKAVFLDRDGTLIHDRPGHYLSRPEDLRVYKNAPEALALLQKHGFRLFIVSNQSGVGRGYFTGKTARAINARLENLFKKRGVKITETVFCPHAPDAGCSCRKPAPLMGERLIKRYKLSPPACYMAGDKKSDAQFGRNLGFSTVFVKTGHGAAQLKKHGGKVADRVTADILSAAKWIIKHEIPD